MQRIFSSATRRELLGKHLKGGRRGGGLKSIGLNWRTERDLCVLIAGLDFGFGSEWSEMVDARDWGNLLRLPRATAVSADKNRPLQNVDNGPRDSTAAVAWPRQACAPQFDLYPKAVLFIMRYP